MKPKLRTLLGLLLVVALSGCISPDKAMKSFLNQPSSELVARWGPPQQRMSDGRGGEIWTYYVHRQWTTPGQANTTFSGTGNTFGNVYANPYGATYLGNTSVYGTASTTYTPPQTYGYTGFREFFIDRSSTIYRYSWKGL